MKKLLNKAKEQVEVVAVELGSLMAMGLRYPGEEGVKKRD